MVTPNANANSFVSMNRFRIVLLVVLTSLIAQLGTPVARAQTDEIESERAKRDEIRQEKLSVIGDLDPLIATEKALNERIALLEENLESQEAMLESVRQQLGQARNRVQLTNEAVAALDREVSAQRSALSLQAVEAYVRPEDTDLLSQVLTSDDMSTAGRRRAFLSSVSQNTLDGVDQLRSSQERLDGLVLEAEDAELDVLSSQERELDVLANIEAAKVEVEAAKADLRIRIEDLLEEIAAHEAEEDAVTAIINGLLAEEERRKAEERQARIAAERARLAQEAIDRGQDPAVALAGASASGGGGSMSWPTSGPVTSGFGPRNINVSGSSRNHQGIDISANTGTPIVSARAGTVIYAGTRGGYGQTVMVNHGDGVVTLYAHMSWIGVSKGATVGQGGTIGHVGSTGVSSGPHLHFEVRVGGVAQNPLGFLP